MNPATNSNGHGKDTSAGESQGTTLLLENPPQTLSEDSMKTLRHDFSRTGKDHIDLICGLSTMCAGDGVQVDWIHPICWNHDEEHFVYIMSMWHPYKPIDCFLTIDHKDNMWVSEIKTANQLSLNDFGL